MPNYRSSHVLPNTLEHVLRVLMKVTPSEWKHVQDAAQNALKGVSLDEKIKPSSLKLISTDSKYELSQKIIQEHVDHNNHHSEQHLGGGLHHGIQQIFKTIWNLLGGHSITRLFKWDKKKRDLSPIQKEAAKLLSGTYASTRPDAVDGWTRIKDYDTEYGSFWGNDRGEYMLSIRGTRPRWKDLFKDGKILAGSESEHNETLEKSIDHFIQQHPDTKLVVSAHSLGTELAMNYFNKIGFENVKDVFLYNPASAFTQSQEHIKNNINNPKVDLFLNSNDPVGSYYAQNLGSDESNVWWGEFIYNPVAAHGLNQWYDSDETSSPETQDSAPPKEPPKPHEKLPPEKLPTVAVI